MTSSNLDMQLKIAIPIHAALVGILLPFVLGYGDANFMWGFSLSSIIFIMSIATLISTDKENTLDSEESNPSEHIVYISQGLTFVLHKDCVRIKTQDGRSYRWYSPDSIGLSNMAKGHLLSGIFHDKELRAILDFSSPSGESIYNIAVNPWEGTETDETWKEDFQILQ